LSDAPDEPTAPEEPTDLTEPGEAPGPGESDDPGEPDGSEASSGSKKSRVGLLVWVLLAVSVVAVVVAFLSWRDADNDPDRDRAELRDTALIEGTTAVETMTSMDGRDVEAGIKAWQQVSTGVLHDQLLAVGDDEQKMLADQGKIAAGRVVQASLTELTDRSATLIAAVEVTVRSEDGAEKPAVKRNRFSADLVLVNGQWKIENLQQVSVNI
jgi:Mce-associated membrane protein